MSFGDFGLSEIVAVGASIRVEVGLLTDLLFSFFRGLELSVLALLCLGSI